MAIGQITSGAEQKRARALVDMGFSATESLLLAATRNEGRHVDLERVREMLAGGCSHQVALRILL